MSTAEASDQSRRIRVLNDFFRSTFLGGRVVMTAGVAALPIDLQARAVLAVQQFSEFDRENDPHGQHDFGSIEVGDETIFWKIDYYDETMEAGSEDPADPTKTTRVLTLMFSSEY
ncbi:DUF3768 domain-containing protein [Bradyrhizobium sediminis]|uniref:DUF3768 domain-containing protein n=1 Tax=Bradyrhizobium sediminis TaxID=2840469 RepID=A0A975RNY5_9BRAD|nr:DUF3768 domain-containing protein [Bradyrhizobium sediminis]QWG14279.1 DUF3768 domain-containing protein [Bradyrhizobium sediminis]